MATKPYTKVVSDLVDLSTCIYTTVVAGGQETDQLQRERPPQNSNIQNSSEDKRASLCAEFHK